MNIHPVLFEIIANRFCFIICSDIDFPITYLMSHTVRSVQWQIQPSKGSHIWLVVKIFFSTHLQKNTFSWHSFNQIYLLPLFFLSSSSLFPLFFLSSFLSFSYLLPLLFQFCSCGQSQLSALALKTIIVSTCTKNWPRELQTTYSYLGSLALTLS